MVHVVFSTSEKGSLRVALSGPGGAAAVAVIGGAGGWAALPQSGRPPAKGSGPPGPRPWRAGPPTWSACPWL